MEEEKIKRALFAKQISWLDTKLLFLRNRVKYRIVPKFSLSWLTIPAFIALSVLIFTAHRSWLNTPTLPENTDQLFYGIGTVTGAMLAIVFAFSSQLVSRASEALPTRYFNLFARDTRLDLSYMAIGIITALEFVLGVITKNKDGQINTTLVRFGIWLILLTIVLLYYCYVRLIRIISHEYQLKWLAGFYMRQVNEITYNANRLAKASRRGYKHLSEKDKLIIEGQIYESLQNQIDALSANLDGIIELYFGYKNKGDDYAAHNYIEVITGMFTSYTLSRQHNSILWTNPETGLTQESSLSAFLQSNLEKVKVIWDKALETNDVLVIRKYLRSVQGIVRVSLMVDYANDPYENPAFYAAYFHFGRLVKDSLKTKNVDALFEIASVLEQIAEIAVTNKHRIDALDSVLNDIKDICVVAAMDDEMSAVTHNLIKNLVTICNRILAQDEISDHRLEKIQEVVPMCLALSAINRKNILTNIQVSHFGDNIFAIATHDMDEPPTEQQIRKIIQTSKFTLAILQKLASVANGNRYETQSANRSIMIMAHTLTKILNDNLATPEQAEDIRRILNDLVRLPESFPSVEKIKRLNDIQDFLDWLIQAAIVAVQANQVDVAANIFDSIHAYLLKLMIDDRGKIEIYDILRVVNDTKLIGGVARKLRKQKLQKRVAAGIQAFEHAYHKKFYPQYPRGVDPKVVYSPSPTFLHQQREINYFGHPSSGLPSYFHDAKGLFLESYTQADLDNFEDYIWQ